MYVGRLFFGVDTVALIWCEPIVLGSIFFFFRPFFSSSCLLVLQGFCSRLVFVGTG